MNELLKNLGVIVLLIGVIILAVPAINGGLSNTILLTGLGVIILGYIGHIVINKRLPLSHLRWEEQNLQIWQSYHLLVLQTLPDYLAKQTTVVLHCPESG